MARRILLLGTTGVAKNVVIDRLPEELHHSAYAAPFEARDFERDYVLPGFDDLPDFLDSDEPRQREGVRSVPEFPPERVLEVRLTGSGHSTPPGWFAAWRPTVFQWPTICPRASLGRTERAPLLRGVTTMSLKRHPATFGAALSRCRTMPTTSSE